MNYIDITYTCDRCKEIESVKVSPFNMDTTIYSNKPNGSTLTTTGYICKSCATDRNELCKAISSASAKAIELFDSGSELPTTLAEFSKITLTKKE